MNVNLYRWKSHFTENILDWSMNAECTRLRWNGLWVAQVQEVSLFRMKHLCFTLIKTATGLGSKIHLPLSLANLCKTSYFWKEHIIKQE